MYEDVVCPACKAVGLNTIETYSIPNYPELDEQWLVCECGQEIKQLPSNNRVGRIQQTR